MSTKDTLRPTCWLCQAALNPAVYLARDAKAVLHLDAVEHSYRPTEKIRALRRVRLSGTELK